jgi:hypothetical protein
VGLKLNGTHQLLVYVDDVNLLGDNTDTIKKNTETLIDVSKDVGLEVNAENIEMDLRETGWGGISGLSWLRIGTSGVLL